MPLRQAHDRDRLASSTDGRPDGKPTRQHRDAPLGLRPNRSEGKSRMTAKLSSRPCQPTALGRRFRITVSALALSAVIGLGAASPSQADVGSVYFDAQQRRRRRERSSTELHRHPNVGLGRTVMPTSPPAPSTSRSAPRLTANHRQLQRRHRPRRAAPTPPATTTSPPATAR